MSALEILNDAELRQAFYDRFHVKAGDVIESSSQAAQHFAGLLTDPGREKFGVIYLNGRNAVTGTEILFEGTLTTAAVYPREIIKRVLELNAAAIIIGHNHPSGSVHPSLMDITVTSTIGQACKLLGISLHDHIITGGDNWFSFADGDLL